MRNLIFNILALAAFGLVLAGEKLGLMETPEAVAERQAEKMDQARESEALAEAKRERERLLAAEERRRREAEIEQRRSLEEVKKTLLTACEAAASLPTEERRQRGQEIRRDFREFLSGEGSELVNSAWADEMSRKLRLLR